MTDLENIRRLLAAGTKGPWESGVCDSEDSEIRYSCSTINVEGGTDLLNGGHAGNEEIDLIVAIVNAAPDLLAELEALREHKKLCDGNQ